jgi:hypothetical protein
MRVESKRKSTPRKRKVNPRNIRPVPILVLSEIVVGVVVDGSRGHGRPCFGVGEVG